VRRYGELLEAAASHGHDLMITCDQCISNGQDVNRYEVASVTIMSGDWAVFRRSLETAVRGEANRVQMIAGAWASVSPATAAAWINIRTLADKASQVTDMDSISRKITNRKGWPPPERIY